MPNKPSRAAIARKLQFLGIPVEYDEQETSPPVLIRQVGGVTESRVFSLPGGGTGIIAYVKITSDVPNLAFSHVELGLPWSDPHFRFLDDPAENPAADFSEYRFPGTQIIFDRQIVLNHKIGVCNILPRGHSIEGPLLAFGYESIPAQFPHGKMLPAFLTAVDKYGSQHSQELEFWIELSAERRATSPHKSKRTPLFGGRDPVSICTDKDKE